MQETLLLFLAEMEAKIEFEETDLLDSSHSNIYPLFEKLIIVYFQALKDNFSKVLSELERVADDSNLYERVKSGFQVLIYGPPNSGKSSLINYLGNQNLCYVFISKL